MVPEYLPVLFMVALAVVIAFGILIATHLVGPRKRTHVKYDVPYESGRDPAGTARLRFDVRFYLVAMIFLVFDLEVVYFYPWAVTFREMVRQSPAILYDMLIFAGILLVGLIYAWRKGALDWR